MDNLSSFHSNFPARTNMKVRKLTRIVKSKLGLKDLRVNLTRLDKNIIHRLMGIPEPNVNCNIKIRIKNGEVTCIKDPAQTIPMTITVTSVYPSSLPTAFTKSSLSNQPNPSVPEVQSSCNQYSLRVRNAVQPKKLEPKSSTTVCEISVSLRKRQLWCSCKKLVDKGKLVIGAVVFGKQSGYAPWPGEIISFNKNRTTATIKYYGFGYFVGKVKFIELVQLDESTKGQIGELISFVLQTKSIKEFNRFGKAVKEITLPMDF